MSFLIVFMILIIRFSVRVVDIIDTIANTIDTMPTTSETIESANSIKTSIDFYVIIAYFQKDIKIIWQNRKKNVTLFELRFSWRARRFNLTHSGWIEPFLLAHRKWILTMRRMSQGSHTAAAEYITRNRVFAVSASRGDVGLNLYQSGMIRTDFAPSSISPG